MILSTRLTPLFKDRDAVVNLGSVSLQLSHGQRWCERRDTHTHHRNGDKYDLRLGIYVLLLRYGYDRELTNYRCKLRVTGITERIITLVMSAGRQISCRKYYPDVVTAAISKLELGMSCKALKA